MYVIISACLFFSSSVPKALSALAASDTDEEDHESTPVITTTNGNNENKPTAPLEVVDEKGNFTSSFLILILSGLKKCEESAVLDLGMLCFIQFTRYF